VRSVSSFDAFFGQATQRPSADPIVSRRAANRASSSERLVLKKTVTAEPGFAPSFRESGVPE
jgi:hypothetical protein